jgi:hypothetical protein
MKKSRLARLAIAGICGASSFTMASTVLAVQNNTLEVAVDANDVVHKCAGLNDCKGLGGCKVNSAKLKKLAKKRGISVEKAGEAHKCAGLNECKGLGGCKMTKSKLEMLKKKKMKK